MNVAYIRVSSKDQNLARQRAALEEYKIEKWFPDKASAKDTERPKLKEMLEFVREGDTVYIVSFDRLARSVADLLQLTDFLKKKKVHLVSVKEKIDSSTANGRLMLTVVGAIAEFERAIIRERQAEGIALAKERGVYAGRKPKKVDEKLFEDCFLLWKERKLTLVDLAKRVGVSRSTAYRLIHQRQQNENQ